MSEAAREAPATCTPQSNAKGYDAETDTRQAIYDAMVDLIYAQGYHGVPLRKVAESVGIRTASLYYHFSSKQALLVEIMTRTLRDVTEAVTTALEECPSDPKSRLYAAVLAHVSFHALRRKEAFVTDSEFRSLEPDNRLLIATMRDKYEALFSVVLREGQDTGDFIQMDERLTLNALIGMCSEVAIWYRPDGRLTINQIAEGYARLFLAREAST